MDVLRAEHAKHYGRKDVNRPDNKYNVVVVDECKPEFLQLTGATGAVGGGTAIFLQFNARSGNKVKYLKFCLATNNKVDWRRLVFAMPGESVANQAMVANVAPGDVVELDDDRTLRDYFGEEEMGLIALKLRPLAPPTAAIALPTAAIALPDRTPAAMSVPHTVGVAIGLVKTEVFQTLHGPMGASEKLISVFRATRDFLNAVGMPIGAITMDSSDQTTFGQMSDERIVDVLKEGADADDEIAMLTTINAISKFAVLRNLRRAQAAGVAPPPMPPRAAVAPPPMPTSPAAPMPTAADVAPAGPTLGVVAILFNWQEVVTGRDPLTSLVDTAYSLVKMFNLAIGIVSDDDDIRDAVVDVSYVDKMR